MLRAPASHEEVVPKNSSLFHFVFCLNDKLIWDFTDMLQPVFSDDGSKKKVREVTVYKVTVFLDGR